jgi:anti-anti-sigma factor
MTTIPVPTYAPATNRVELLKFYLVVANGKHRGMPVPINVDLFVIGTAKTCQMKVRHPEVGEQHCALVSRGRKVFIRDLDSGKPTFVNGQTLPPSEEWPVHKGDTVRVGPLEFRVSVRQKDLSQRDLEEWALKTLDEDTGPRKSAFDEIDEAFQGADREYQAASEAAAAILMKASVLKGVLRGRLRITRDGSLTVVRLQDEYLVEPAELSLLKKDLFENLTGKHMRVLLDLKNVRRMSAAAVGLFAELSEELKSRGSVMALCRMRPELAGVVCDLRNLFNIRIFDDKEKAQAARW